MASQLNDFKSLYVKKRATTSILTSHDEDECAGEVANTSQASFEARCVSKWSSFQGTKEAA